MSRPTPTRVRSLGLLGALLLAACPPGLGAGPRGDACSDHADCNAGSCGELIPCVRGFCLAEEPRIVVLCTDAGIDSGAPFECDDWEDCNGVDCGDGLVACIGGRCDADAPTLTVPCDAGPPGCSGPADCALALPYDRQCGPCPQALSREEIAGDGCVYPADEVPVGPADPACYADCKAPTVCDEPPIGADCSAGRCEPIHGPCEREFTLGEEILSAGEAQARGPKLVGRRITVFGGAFIGDPVCAEVGCDPGPRCTAPLLLDSVVEIRGSQCGVPAVCDDAGCASLSCRPLAVGGSYRVTGFWATDGVDYWLELVSFEEG